MNYTYATVIVPEGNIAQAREELGEGFFTTPASPTGELPATHYFSSGPFNNDELNFICNKATWPRSVYFGQDWQAALDAVGLKMVVEAEISMADTNPV